ncbi:MAG TPA: hypothetical protein VM053_09260 [Gemmatimonadaceae bacterium]|nr:hypothetical protein [Gemmatimonadaceae bacterium]
MSFLNIAVTVLTLAFGASGPEAFQRPAAGRSAPLRAPSWRGATGDLSVDLMFEQFRDSIYARGTYKTEGKKRIGCGGQTLARNGNLTMRAKGNIASFRGKFLFDSGWMPPVSAKQTSTGTVKVNIGAVDKPRCVLTLEKWIRVGGSR